MFSSLPSLEDVHRLLVEGVYPSFLTDSFMNDPAPSSTISFTLGGMLWLISVGMWIYRLSEALSYSGGSLSSVAVIRAVIACATDNDSPIYTIISFTGISLIFLGGIQEDYENTVVFMYLYYFCVSFGESLQIILAYLKYSNITEIEIVTSMDRTLEDNIKKLKGREKTERTTVLNPNNVYEDMGQFKIIVILVFITQFAVISFVSLDVYLTDTHWCFDGTQDCPVGHTVGSYGLYFVGIMQSCVYLLGPSSNFGQSEQNPAFWISLLLASKQNDMKLMWVNDRKEKPNRITRVGDDGNIVLDEDGEPQLHHHINFYSSDFIMWLRFLMSYLINGIGFHILVHTLPMQVAASGSLIGLIYRIVGMLYLVDLDDTAGYTLYITNKANAGVQKGIDDQEKPLKDIAKSGEPELTKEEYDERAQQIIDIARSKLNALAEKENAKFEAEESEAINFGGDDENTPQAIAAQTGGVAA